MIMISFFLPLTPEASFLKIGFRRYGVHLNKISKVDFKDINFLFFLPPISDQIYPINFNKICDTTY